MNRPRVAILASGEGTTAEAFIRASAEGQIEPEVGLVICNNKNAGIFKRVAALNKEYGLAIKAVHIGRTTHPPRSDEQLRPGDQSDAEEQAILQALHDGNYDLVALMGYMKRIGKELVQEYGHRPDHVDAKQARMVNTHPGLLPETKGLYGVGVQQHVLERGLSHGGQTLHVVAEEYDEGPTIAEHKVAVKPGDTPDSLFDRVKAAEKKHLPQDIAVFIAQSQSPEMCEWL